jgi:hypothetical protein
VRSESHIILLGRGNCRSKLRFDKRYIYLVRNDEIKNLSNSDNSLFEIGHAERSFNQSVHNEMYAKSEVKFGE